MEKLQNIVNRLFDHKHFHLIACAIIAVMVLIAYSNTFTASFHFDDTPSIIENASIRHVTWENISTLLLGSRPVVSLSFMLNYALGSLNVVGYHIFNITVHIFNGWLVYLLMIVTLGLPVFAGGFDDKAKRMALFAALLFSVHPVQTESVTYIVSRSELLATVFYLSTFLLFIRGAQTGRIGYYIASFFTSLLSMGSKQWAVTLPAMLVLYDYLFLSEGKFRKIVAHWKGYLLATIPTLYVLENTNLTVKVGNEGFGFGMQSATGITPWTYLLTSCNVIWTYIRLLFLPINQNLDYDYPVTKTLFEFPTLLSAAGHVAMLVLAFWLYRKKKMLLAAFSIAWFYIGLSPVQSFVPIIDVIFEHRVYMPSIGFFILFVLAYEGAFAWWEKRRTASAPASA